MVPFVREWLLSDGEELVGWFFAFVAALLFGVAIRRRFRAWKDARSTSEIAKLRAQRDALRVRVIELERYLAAAAHDEHTPRM